MSRSRLQCGVASSACRFGYRDIPSLNPNQEEINIETMDFIRRDREDEELQ